MTPFRIGQGYDVHAFCAGDALMIGGVRIPFTQAFLAHSDGDVALHALSDALLGAAALGDIGQHFPDSDPQFKGADSRQLLRHVWQLIQQQGYLVGNVDVTIVAQAPKMSPYIDAMRHVIAADLKLAINAVNVKATTTEKLGFIGQQQGISAYAVALLYQTQS